MDNENGVQVIVEEPNPYHLTSKGKAWITCWDTWVSLCKDDSAKDKITTLFISVVDEKGDRLEITGFKNLRKLVIQDRSFQKVREIKIHDLENLTEVFINDLCFNEIPKRSVNSTFMIYQCFKLCEVNVGRGSLTRLQSCSIHETPSLEKIQWGDGSFVGCEFFYLKSVIAVLYSFDR